MLFASSEKSPHIGAKPGLVGAICLACQEPVIPKCGDVRIWHFAHKAETECSEGKYPKTFWHYNWQKRFPESSQEVVVISGGKRHVADVKIEKMVYEFQRKMMPMADMLEREGFYRALGCNFRWVFDHTDGIQKGWEGATLRFQVFARKDHWTFIWRWAPKWINLIQTPFYIDIGNGKIFKVIKIHSGSRPFRGWGLLGDWHRLAGVNPVSRNVVTVVESGHVCTECFFSIKKCDVHGV